MNAITSHWAPDNNIMLSVIVPVFNEREVLPIFYERTVRVLKAAGIPYEILFVDDGSTDDSAEFLITLATHEPALKVVQLSRNFGKEAAVTAGIDQALGMAAIIIDADLQDPPEQIPHMLEQWYAGADVVCMRRAERSGETRLKRYSAHLFYRLLNRISRFDIPEDTGDFRLMSRRALDAIKQLPERHRYMKGLFAWIGMPTVVLHYDRDARAVGKTKWGYGALFGLAFEGITSFSITPLRWATGLGLLAALMGTLFGASIVIKTLLYGDPVQGYPSLMAMMTFLGGIQLLSVGILGEYVGKTYFEAKQRPVYLIRDVIESQSLLQPEYYRSTPVSSLQDTACVASH